MINEFPDTQLSFGIRVDFLKVYCFFFVELDTFMKFCVMGSIYGNYSHFELILLKVSSKEIFI